MCGIAGFVDKKNKLDKKQKASLVKLMLGTIKHRGFDGMSFFISEKVTLGHCRLSIIDVSAAGNQPFFSKRKDMVLSYNGEIYNYLELNQVLKNDFKFKSNCDTETLLHAYEKWGIDALPKLKGMFAFSLYNQNDNALILAVDRFGIKPLYYYNDKDFFIFSSEIKAILKFLNKKVELNSQVLAEHLLYRSVSGKFTLIKNIFRIEPANILRLDLTNFRIKKKKYYQIKKHSLNKECNTEKFFLNFFLKSINEHLIADVPVGLQLSGGVDSSLTAAIATCIKKQHFHTFSIGLKKAGWNEFRYSRFVAKKYKTKHHELYFNENDFCDLLPLLTYQMDEPINHPNSVPMYILSKYARNKVKVLISGEGADEVFLGYKRYGNLFRDRNLNEKKIIESSQFINLEKLKKIYAGKVGRPYENREKIIKNQTNLYDKLFCLDMATYLPPLLLRQDKMGMAANIENRVPFLDHELVEYGFSLPLEQKLDGIETKKIIKTIAIRFLPKNLVYRPKVGFGLPISEWLRNRNGLGKYLNIFTNKNSIKRSFLNYNFLKKIIKEHKAGERDHGQLLWIIISLEIWLQIFVDGKKYCEINKNL